MGVWECGSAQPQGSRIAIVPAQDVRSVTTTGRTIEMSEGSPTHLVGLAMYRVPPVARECRCRTLCGAGWGLVWVGPVAGTERGW